MLDLDNTKTFDEKQSKYLSKGINENVTIGTFTFIQPEGGKPYIEVILHKASSNLEDGTKFKLHTTPEALKYTKDKLVHLATKIISREDLNKLDKESPDFDTLATKLTQVLGGKTIDEVMLGSEVYYNQEGKKRDKLFIPLAPFAHQKRMGNRPAKMVWDENNKYLYKPASSPDPEPGKSEDDLPF